MPLTLTVTDGPNRGQVFTFEQHDLFLVGRSAEAHFAVPDDPYFSRLHFLVEFNPPLCRILDMRSRSGTFVNGERVTATRDLRDSDEVRAGQTSLRVALASANRQQAVTLPPATGIPLAEPVSPPPAEGFSGPPSAQEPASSSIPTTMPHAGLFPSVSGYRLVGKLGEGGMGVVYQARRDVDGLVVALKTLKPAVSTNESAIARFLREADVLRQLQHPHIVSFLDMGLAGELLYFAMEYVPGQNLAEVRRQHTGPFPIGRAVRLVCQLLEALSYAHGRGFVHRDIKPANVLTTGDVPAEQARLADFGLARTYQASQLSGLTLTNTAGGTPQYMPPEQVRDFRSVKPAADQYAAAATLYFLLTGQTLYPTATNTTDLLLQILQQAPTPIESVRHDLPAGLCCSIGRALSRRHGDRFADVGQFRQELLPFSST